MTVLVTKNGRKGKGIHCCIKLIIAVTYNNKFVIVPIIINKCMYTHSLLFL